MAACFLIIISFPPLLPQNEVTCFPLVTIFGFSGDGMERLHFILEGALEAGNAPLLAEEDQCAQNCSVEQLSQTFLHEMAALHSFDTNPIYYLLHESIYADGPGAGATAWAAAAVHEALSGTPFDFEVAINSGADTGTLYFTGEMVRFPQVPFCSHASSSASHDNLTTR